MSIISCAKVSIFLLVTRELRLFTVEMTHKKKQTFANECSAAAADFTIETVFRDLGGEQRSIKLPLTWIRGDPSSQSLTLYKGKLPGADKEE